MPLATGTRVGAYDIVNLIGVGGMGEVYRARDTKLKRDVAIKVLPSIFASDADRLARFTREAQTLASLNHPNIAAIYGIEESHGVRALVMELVDGSDLSVPIARGPMPVDAALAIARQLTDALAAAHDHGVVHRDLKPANIKIRPNGMVKVLDFGLAKAMDPDAVSSADALTSPTISIHATQAGIILGTAAYMSPEQARGRPVDKRSDIWAFGCVLYEMLTGRRVFDGEDVSDIVAAVIKDEPRWDGVPAIAERLIKKCLQKDPTQRLRDIGDAWELLAPSDPARLAVRAPARSPWRAGAAWSAAALALIAVAALSFVHFGEQSPAGELVRFQIPAPEHATINSLSVSPNGRQVAFTARAADGRNLLWVRSLETLETRALPGIESGPTGLFWSPDSRWIGFAIHGTMKKVEASGGPAQPVCDFQGSFLGAAWSREGVIVFGTFDSGGLMQVSESGGTPSLLVMLEHPGALEFQGYPTLLPDHHHFLYQRFSSAPEARGIYLGSINTSPAQQESKRLLIADAPAVYAASGDTPTGRLIFRRDESLMAQAFNTDRLALVGQAVPIADGLSAALGPPQYSASPNVLVYRQSVAAESQLVWYDPKGKPLRTLGPPGDYSDVQLSPDGTKVVVGMGGAGGTGHLWTADTTRGVFSRLNPGDTADLAPAVSPDGRVIFSLFANGSVADIYRSSLSGTPELLVKSGVQKHSNHVSLDGRFLIYDAHTLTKDQDLWILPLTGEGKPIPFLTTAADETFGQFSPDGNWIAYSSDESKRREVYVQRFALDRDPASGTGKVQVSPAGGDKPRWRRDGRELYYIAPDGKMMAVPVKIGATFEPGVATPLFDAHATGYFPYDVSADGRFLINTVPEMGTASASPILVVLNWQSGVRR